MKKLLVKIVFALAVAALFAATVVMPLACGLDSGCFL
jgi:hypothetical protein